MSSRRGTGGFSPLALMLLAAGIGRIVCVAKLTLSGDSSLQEMEEEPAVRSAGRQRGKRRGARRRKWPAMQPLPAVPTKSSLATGPVPIATSRKDLVGYLEPPLSLNHLCDGHGVYNLSLIHI